MVWLSDCEKMKMFSRFDRVHERDGRTERQTLHDGIGMSEHCHSTPAIPFVVVLFGLGFKQLYSPIIGSK